jgi:hypothetical protein
MPRDDSLLGAASPRSDVDPNFSPLRGNMLEFDDDLSSVPYIHQVQIFPSFRKFQFQVHTSDCDKASLKTLSSMLPYR